MKSLFVEWAPPTDLSGFEIGRVALYAVNLEGCRTKETDSSRIRISTCVAEWSRGRLVGDLPQPPHPSETLRDRAASDSAGGGGDREPLDADHQEFSRRTPPLRPRDAS